MNKWLKINNLSSNENYYLQYHDKLANKIIRLKNLSPRKIYSSVWPQRLPLR